MGWLAIDPEAIGNPIALPAIGCPYLARGRGVVSSTGRAFC
jgi:hypothetical protein